jgi:hypothetical protein
LAKSVNQVKSFALISERSADHVASKPSRSSRLQTVSRAMQKCPNVVRIPAWPTLRTAVIAFGCLEIAAGLQPLKHIPERGFSHLAVERRPLRYTPVDATKLILDPS